MESAKVRPGGVQRAVRDGKSLGTSLSFTPTAGLPMSARSGDLDPGPAWYPARAENMSPKQINDMLIGYKRYIDKNGGDQPEIRNWTWGGPR